MKKILYVLIIFQFISTEVFAQSIEELEREVEQGDEVAMYKLVTYYDGNRDSTYLDSNKAALLLKQVIEKDNPRVEYHLAILFQKGEVTPKNISSAVLLMKRSASHNFPSALFDLAKWYYKGINIEKSYDKAVDFFQKFNENRTYKDKIDNIEVIAPIESYLGNIYYEGGFGIEKNLEKAVKYFLTAAESGNILGESARKLAICYKWGYGGLPKDDAKAKEWMEKAKSLKDEIAEIALDMW